MGEKIRMNPLSTILLFLGVLLLFSSPAAALKLGPQPINPVFPMQTLQDCSRTCESEFCTDPPLLRYGKYCGLLYSGCPGQKPCDALDTCCMAHDVCVDRFGYLSIRCSKNLLRCMARIRNRKQTFRSNKCAVHEVIDVISVTIKAAVVAGRVLHQH